MTLLLILIAAALALIAAAHYVDPCFALEDEWDRSAPTLQDLELLQMSEDRQQDAHPWALWRPDFNQRKLSF